MKRYLMAGLLVWVPLGITIWVMRLAGDDARPDAAAHPRARCGPRRCIGFHIPGLGVLLSFAILLITGVLAANFFGQRLIKTWEAILGRIPVRQIDLLVGQAGQRHACSPTRARRSARRCSSNFRGPAAGPSRS